MSTTSLTSPGSLPTARFPDPSAKPRRTSPWPTAPRTRGEHHEPDEPPARSPRLGSPIPPAKPVGAEGGETRTPRREAA